MTSAGQQNSGQQGSGQQGSGQQGQKRLGAWLSSFRGHEMVEGSRRGDWPGEELLHPVPILCMILLGVNDHVLKGSGWVPGVVTGKLSDFAGLVFFPLFLTALLNTVMFGVFRSSERVRWDYSLTRWKLWGALGVTVVVFAPLQFYSTWAEIYVRGLQALDLFGWFHGFAVTPDPWDLTALLVLPWVYWFGRRTVVSVPVGRLAVIRRRMEAVAGEGGAGASAGPDEWERVFRRGTQDIRAFCRTQRRTSKEKGAKATKSAISAKTAKAVKALEAFGQAFGVYVQDPTDATAQKAQQALDTFRDTTT